MLYTPLLYISTLYVPIPPHTHITHTYMQCISLLTMDSVLSDFIGRTHADPAFAQDLLEAAGWNMESALALFDGLKDTRAIEPEEYHYDPSENTNSIN